jgi:transcriptional regulator with XRE-family HTH domain
MKTKDYANFNAADELEPRVQVDAFELEPFVARLNAMVGPRKTREFARKAGVHEATLRATLKGAEPRVSLLAAIAAAGGKSLDWMVFGREQRSASHAMDRELLRQIVEGMAEGIERSGWDLRPAEWARLVLLWYDELSELPRADPKAHILSFYPNEQSERPGAPDQNGAGDDESAPD